LGQNADLDPALSARDNVLLAAAFREVAAAEARADALLVALGIAARAHTRAAVLSGGEAVRVAIARAVLARPAVVIADEPTAALDPASAALVNAALMALAGEEGISLIVASHDPTLIAACHACIEVTC
jgi:putative ABC transport system ATP-binding protein